MTVEHWIALHMMRHSVGQYLTTGNAGWLRVYTSYASRLYQRRRVRQMRRAIKHALTARMKRTGT